MFFSQTKKLILMQNLDSPAPNCQVISFISSRLTFPRIRITFRVFQFFGLYGNAITGLMSADLKH